MSSRSCRFGFHAPSTFTPKCCVAPMRMRVWYVSSKLSSRSTWWKSFVPSTRFCLTRLTTSTP
jgi:hypothetical protein